MYFQTSQVIFVQEWPKGEFVSIIGLILCLKKSLVCKDVVLQGIPLFRVMSEDSALLSIVPSRPDDVPYRPDASQTKHHPSGRRAFSVRTSTVSRSYCSSLYPPRHLSSQSGRISVIDQLQILSKFRIRED
jgi:hypothetical protein